MKKILNKSILIASLLGALIITGCKDLPFNSIGSGTDDTSSASSSVDNCISNQGETLNGVTTILGLGQACPVEGLAFKVESLNQEFLLKNNDLYVKDADRWFLSFVATLYLADANKDGYLDFIFTSLGERSMNDAGVWVGVYDYKNSQYIYRLDDPNEFDYRVYLSENNFVVEQTSSDYWNSKNVIERGRLVGKGILDFSGAQITTKWQNFLNIDSYDFNVTISNSSRTPVTLKTGEDNTFIVEHASVDNAYCITTNIIRNNNNYNDLTSDLPVGYRLNGDYRLIQAVANNKQDNVIITLDATKLAYNECDVATVEVCVSGFIYKIIFDFDTLDYDPNHTTLMETLGWSFPRSHLLEFTREYIPGPDNDPYTEEENPFLTVSTVTVDNNREAVEESYKILEAKITEIDPALVDTSRNPCTYIFKTRNNAYSYTSQGSYIKYNNSYYLMVYAENYSYALGVSTAYLRFRDERSEIRVEALVPGLESQVIQNATDIIFKSTNISNHDQVERYKQNASYTFNIAGNQFYIIDAKTMILNSGKYEVVSDADFSQLFPVK